MRTKAEPQGKEIMSDEKNNPSPGLADVERWLRDKMKFSKDARRKLEETPATGYDNYSEKKKETARSTIIAVLLFAPVMLLVAYTLKSLWWWFMFPLGVPAIGLAHACGIDCLLTFIVWPAFAYYTDKKQPALAQLLTSAMVSGIILLVGKIAHAIMVGW